MKRSTPEQSSTAAELIQLSDHETVVTRQGSYGPPVVLLHGLGLDWRMWEPVMGKLSQGRRVFAYDIRGHGSAIDAPSPIDMTDNANDLILLLDRLDLAQAHIVGLSFGGAIAQTAAVNHPERFTSLSLLATTDQIAPDVFESRARSSETDGMKAQVEPSLTRWFTTNTLAENNEAVRYARKCILRGSPSSWAASWRAFKTLDVQGKLEDLAVPTLVIGGELDVSSTPEVMKALAQRIRSSHYKELPGATHMQTLETPELVAAALDEFLPSQPQLAS